MTHFKEKERAAPARRCLNSVAGGSPRVLVAFYASRCTFFRDIVSVKTGYKDPGLVWVEREGTRDKTRISLDLNIWTRCHCVFRAAINIILYIYIVVFLKRNDHYEK